MEENEYFSTEAWLLSGLINSLPGILTLDGGMLIFTAIGTGTFGDSGIKKLEKMSGAEISSLLNQGKPAQLFSVKLSEIKKITFPLIYFSAGTHITVKDEKYRLSFIQPNNTKMPILDRSDYEEVFERGVEIMGDISHSRSVGKKWKSLLTK